MILCENYIRFILTYYGEFTSYIAVLIGLVLFSMNESEFFILFYYKMCRKD